MPITLPKISRREFLKRATLVSAAMSLPSVSHAGLFSKSHNDPHTLAFFSDTHIAADATLTHLNGNMTEHLTAAVSELLTWPVKPGNIIVNGDLAYKAGQAADYAAFRKIIEPMRELAPVHLTLGNHDTREIFWEAFPHDTLKIKSVPEKQVGLLATPYVNWFLLDSLATTDSAPGELGAAQLEWLTHELNLHFHRPAIIVVHHNLQFTPITTGLRDTSALMDLLVRKRQVKAVVYGHTHDWRVTQHESGIYQINLPPTAYPFHEKRPCGWVRATLAKDGAEFELRCLDVKHPQQGQVEKLKWRAA